MDASEIKKLKPFGLNITRAESLAGPGAISGEAYMVITGHKRYKLRICYSAAKAKQIEENVRKLPEAFPQFYGREGKYLLFRWNKGTKPAKPVSVDVCYQIGKLAGKAHALNDATKEDTYFESRLAYIENGLAKKLRRAHDRLKKKLKVDIVLELHDLNLNNIMVEGGKVCIVDEEELGHRPKGLGFAKPLFTDKYISSKEQVKAFWKGYNEHSSSDFFTKDYAKYVEFLQLVRSLATRKKIGRDVSDLEEKIQEWI